MIIISSCNGIHKYAKTLSVTWYFECSSSYEHNEQCFPDRDKGVIYVARQSFLKQQRNLSFHPHPINNCSPLTSNYPSYFAKQ